MATHPPPPTNTLPPMGAALSPTASMARSSAQPPPATTLPPGTSEKLPHAGNIDTLIYNNKTIKLYPENSKKREAAELKRLKREVGALHRRELERDRRRDQLKREERDRRRIRESIREELKERSLSDRRSRIDDYRRRGY